jgi:hypothetical protein
MKSTATVPDTIPAGARMLQMVLGAFVSKSLVIAARLDIAGRLAAGPLTVEDLGKRAGADAGALQRVLRALASVGVFQENEVGEFSNTELSSTLRSDVAGSMKSMALFLCDDPLWAAWGELGFSVGTGRSAFERVHGSSAFSYMATHPEFGRVFGEAMGNLTEQDLAAIHAEVDFSSMGTLVDIAGGHGALLVSCLQKNAQQKGILFDAPDVVARARPLVEAAGVAARCEFVAGDFFKGVPAGADTYMMKYILHDWSDEDALRILKSIHGAARRGTRLLIIDPIVKPGNAPDIAKLMDLQMLVFYGGGRERTLEEFKSLLRAANFRFVGVVPTASPLSVIEAARE